MREFSPIDIEQIILMAWGDTISFEQIEREYGLSADELKRFMKAHQSPQTYTRWRKRVHERTGHKSKHEQLTSVSSRRQKFPI